MAGASKLPQHLGRYEIAGEIATGGMAEILLGRVIGPSGFERPVVIKRILPHLARSRRFVDMFLDEARIVARIRHANVVQVHELVRDGDELFMVMEYLEGETISALLRRLWAQKRQLDPALVATIIADACAGLHAAHELRDEEGRPIGLVHRDVSPQNILITYDGVVKLIDFGIAKVADGIARTETGTLKGKLSYMAPEQCVAEALDRRADIFSLGSVLFELATTTRLFHRDNQLLIMRAICEDPIPSITDHRQGFPGALDAVCRRALVRDKDGRYATARDMRADLVKAMRQLDPIEPDALGTLMHEAFGDRVADKRRVMEQVQEGTAVTLPEPETDVGVDIPVLAPVAARPPASRRMIWGAAAVAGVALTLGAVLLGAPEPIEDPAPRAAPPAAAPSTASPSAVPPAPPAVSVEAPSATPAPSTAAHPSSKGPVVVRPAPSTKPPVPPAAPSTTPSTPFVTFD